MERDPNREAARRNEAMRIQNPDRANEIEWYAGQDGRIYLRDRPEWTAQHTAYLARRAERDREDWKRAQRQAGNL